MDKSGKTFGEQYWWRSNPAFKPPETPLDSMEFLSRSWSPSATEVSRAVVASPPLSSQPPQMRFSEIQSGSSDVTLVPEDEENGVVAGNTFSFASSETSLMVMERIMAQSPEITSPRTSGRLSHSSFTDSPPISPSDIDDFKQFYRISPSFNGHIRGPSAIPGTAGGSKTVGRWLKDRREKKREETRAQNAQLHAAVSVAGVAAAVAAIAAATASQSSAGTDEKVAKNDSAVASAATLVAAQCVEAAEIMGADREHLASVVSSAVNVRSAGDIMTLTAAAATALRGAATLKARALKEVWNIAAVIPVDKGIPKGSGGGYRGGELAPEDNFLGVCSKELLAKGCELLKRTRKGDLHWKVVSIYINRTKQVVLKTKSKHVAGTITKKKKNVVVELVKGLPAWPGRELLEGGENLRYFGLKTFEKRVIEFECKSQREYDLWTQGVSMLLSIVSDRKHKC
ncbi:PREDICTED: VAN3-binding protein-like [Camelina sativa]|uniref:VAN3-binding protein-like n=1 Tax=Camelina sativa TaxID=90675 RepID=A0ABM0X7C8_CAMSA|nr:PREDICTED: VAN3-binding protein-like [Camelina sativa]